MILLQEEIIMQVLNINFNKRKQDEKNIFFNIIDDNFYSNSTLFISRECFYSNKKFTIFITYGLIYENDSV